MVLSEPLGGAMAPLPPPLDPPLGRLAPDFIDSPVTSSLLLTSSNHETNGPIYHPVQPQTRLARNIRELGIRHFSEFSRF